MGRRTQANKKTHQGSIPKQPGNNPTPRHSKPGRRQKKRLIPNLVEVFRKTVKRFLPNFSADLNRFPDPRDTDSTYYPVPTLIWSVIVMYLLGLRSRRQYRFESKTDAFVANLNGIAGSNVETAPHDGTIVYYLMRIAAKYVRALPASIIKKIIRSKALDKWRLHGRFLVAVDATKKLFYRHRHCPSCLTQKREDGTIWYFHYVLEAKLITANGFAFSMATEFIENEDPKADKQDCERNAFKRLAPKLKASFPQLPIILLADSLYACGPVFEICRENNWQFIFSLKEGSLPNLFDEYETLRDLTPKNRVGHRDGKVKQSLAWVNDLEHGGHKVSVFECHEITPAVEHHFVWVTNIEVGCASVITLANQGGRLRWKIENEGFNIQKNHGYELEHAYSEDEKVAKDFYYLLQVAHTINQLILKGSLLGDFDKVVGSIRNYLRRFAEAFRQTVIDWTGLDSMEAEAFQIRFDTS